MNSRLRQLNRSLDDLFPIRQTAVYRCFSCGWKTSFEYDPKAVLIYDDCPECGESLGEGKEKNIFRKDDGRCRVCGDPASERRTRYCSERCKNIAAAVQSMFSWNSVRKRILKRDDHTCQNCGEDVSEDADAEPEVDHITPISDDGHPFDERNLLTLCSDCHTEKTHGDLNITDEADGLTVGDYLE